MAEPSRPFLDFQHQPRSSVCPLCLNDDYNMLLAAEARIAELTHEVAGLKIERDNAIGRARRAWDLVAERTTLPAQEQETPSDNA